MGKVVVIILRPEILSSSLRPGFEGCSEIMNDPLYLRFLCLEQDEIFPENKPLFFLNA